MSPQGRIAATRVIHAGVVRRFFLPNPGEMLKASAHKREEALSELHRQNSDLQGLRSGIHLDLWGTGVLPVTRSRERARALSVLPYCASCLRRRRRRVRGRRQCRTARVLHGDMQQLRGRGASPVPATRRQARVLQLLLRAGPSVRFSSLRLTEEGRSSLLDRPDEGRQCAKHTPERASSRSHESPDPKGSGLFLFSSGTPPITRSARRPYSGSVNARPGSGHTCACMSSHAAV